jgi:hypothetical protein
MMFGFGEPNELKLIPSLLWPGEKMQMYAKAVSEDNAFGILALTNKRVIFCAKGLSGNKTEDFPFDQIASIDCATPPLIQYSTVTIQAKGGFSKFKNVPKGAAQEFAQKTRQAVQAWHDSVRDYRSTFRRGQQEQHGDHGGREKIRTEDCQ